MVSADRPRVGVRKSLLSVWKAGVAPAGVDEARYGSSALIKHRRPCRLYDRGCPSAFDVFKSCFLPVCVYKLVNSSHADSAVAFLSLQLWSRSVDEGFCSMDNCKIIVGVLLRSYYKRPRDNSAAH